MAGYMEYSDETAINTQIYQKRTELDWKETQVLIENSYD